MLNNLREIAQHYHFTGGDYNLAAGILGSGFRQADLVIAPDGKPLLYRWYVVPHNEKGNVYFHIQVTDDPERPLHDHPWDNMSVILAGGYTEIIDHYPNHDAHMTVTYDRVPGRAIFRRAAEAHRLLLPRGTPYTMTLFSTGPKIREWGFWYSDGWRNANEVTKLQDGISVHITKEGIV